MWSTWPASCFDGLNDHGNALAATNAGCCDPIAAAAALEFMRQRKHQPGPCGGKWMTEADCSTVHVHFLNIKACLLYTSDAADE